MEPSGGYAARLATRKDELARLAALKSKMIARINTATPKLRKSSLLIPGINADLAKADDKAITARFDDGKTESHEWAGMSDKSVERLVHLAADKDSPDDWLAAGLLFLTPVGGASLPRDAQAAEEAFDKAKSLGALIDRYLDPLAAASFAAAKSLLEEGRGAETRRLQGEKFAAAETVLAALEKKYGTTPWLAANKDDVAAAHAAAKAGIAESEAEKLYAEAQKLFEQKELFDLKPIIVKLKTNYPNTKPVTEETRKPSFAEMLKATETLGKFITVRQDGKGDFKTIQAAIDAAPPNSLVEIQDAGPYNESVKLRMGSIVVRGRRGVWPIVTSLGPRGRSGFLVEVTAPDSAMEHLLLVHALPGEGSAACIRLANGSFRLRSAFLYVDLKANTRFGDWRRAVVGQRVVGLEAEDCVFAARIDITNNGKPVILRNCALLQGLSVDGRLSLHFCTAPAGASTREGRNQGQVADSILSSFGSVYPNFPIEYCNVYGMDGYAGEAKPGKGCFSADPQFRDPDNFDYRLKPTSPCHKRASDGGDIGCRYTPEMLEILEKALELRKKGIIKF